MEIEKPKTKNWKSKIGNPKLANWSEFVQKERKERKK